MAHIALNDQSCKKKRNASSNDSVSRQPSLPCDTKQTEQKRPLLESRAK